MDSTFKTIASFENAIDAEIARGRLESEGIAAHIRDATMVGTNWLYSNAVGGVKLEVNAADVDQARQLLDDAKDESLDDEGWGSCPQCGSRKLDLRTDRRITHVTWLLFGIPLLFPRKQFVCRECEATSTTPNE